MKTLQSLVKKLSDQKNIFLTGGAGVGKTTMTKEVIEHFKQDAKKVARLASTGMAATLIEGQTLHSFLDIGIANTLVDLQESGKFEIKKKTKKLIFGIDLIVIDEISMVSDTLFEIIEHRLIQAEFKGSLLIVGDFLQLPPVVKGNDEVKYAFESRSWKNFDFEVVELTQIHRTDDVRFIKLLGNVRKGYVDETVHNHLNEYIKPLPQEYSQFTFLFGKNHSASAHNKAQLAFVEGDLLTKEAQIIKHNQSTKDKEVENFIRDARIEKILELKIGVPVLFTRNAWNYFNGEKGRVLNIDEQYVYVQKADGKTVKLEAIRMSKSKWVEKVKEGKKQMQEEDLFSVYQYPIKLAYAITIHKSQGMSIEDLIIATHEIFAPSQFYVALSRCSNPARLNLIAPNRQWYELIYAEKKALEFVGKVNQE